MQVQLIASFVKNPKITKITRTSPREFVLERKATQTNLSKLTERTQKYTRKRDESRTILNGREVSQKASNNQKLAKSTRRDPKSLCFESSFKLYQHISEGDGI